MAEAAEKKEGPEYQPIVNPDCPLLSFLYSLYCKPEVAEDWVKGFRTARRAGKPDDIYLEHYRASGKFPEVADLLITKLVPSNPAKRSSAKKKPSVSTQKVPTEEQAYMIIPDLAYELASLDAGKRNSRPVARTSQAALSRKRPVLSCLAFTYANHNRGFSAAMKEALESSPLPSGTKAKLLAIAKNKNGVPTVEQILALSSVLVKELISPPLVW